MNHEIKSSYIPSSVYIPRKRRIKNAIRNFWKHFLASFFFSLSVTFLAAGVWMA